MKKLKATAFILMLIYMLTALSPAVFATADDTQQTEPDDSASASPTPVPPKEGFVCDTLPEPNSEAIYMVSLDTGTVVYALNPDERRSMASLTKIMTYIVVSEAITDLKNTEITVPESVITELLDTWSSLAEIQAGETFSAYELLALMMIPSANDAALTLSKYVESLQTDGKTFVDLMNEKAEALGCKDTHFTNPHGLYDEEHYTTAREMGMITQYALTLPYFAEISSQISYTLEPTEIVEEERDYTTTNRMLLNYEDEYYTYATGIKTGSLNESGYCIAASGLYEGYSYLVICLGSPMVDADGNPIDYHGEMYDAAELLRWAFLNIRSKTVASSGDLLGEVPLEYAWEKDRLQVVAAGNVVSMLPSTVADTAIKTTVDLPESVKAPVKKGDEIGTATFTYENEVIATVKLVAAESVERSEVVQTIEQSKEIASSPWFLITVSVLLALAVAYFCLFIALNRRRRKMRRVKKYRDM